MAEMNLRAVVLRCAMIGVGSAPCDNSTAAHLLSKDNMKCQNSIIFILLIK